MTVNESSHGRVGAASTADLVSQAAAQISTLVRDDLALAKAELTEKGKRAGVGGGLFGAAAAAGCRRAARPFAAHVVAGPSPLTARPARLSRTPTGAPAESHTIRETDH